MGYIRLTDAVHLGYVMLAHKSFQASNSINCTLGQLVKVVRLARSGNLPSLVYHVGNIIRLSSQEQVIRIHTTWIVTFVQYAHSGRYASIGFHVGDSVRLLLSAHITCPAVTIPVPASGTLYTIKHTQAPRYQVDG